MVSLELHEISLKMKPGERKAEMRTGESQRGRERVRDRQSPHPVIWGPWSSYSWFPSWIQLWIQLWLKKKTTCCVAQNFVSGAGVCKWQALICSMGRIGVGSGAVWSSPSLKRKWAVSDMWSKVAKPSPVWVWGFRLQHSVSFEIQRPCLKKKKKKPGNGCAVATSSVFLKYFIYFFI